VFEWQDGNPYGEDRTGYLVTVDDGYIRKATASDRYILGAVSSASPCTANAQKATVCMMGMLPVYDDGSCKPNGFCQPYEEGIVSAGKRGYFVVKRLDKNKILALLDGPLK
jgi:hypothetical protein